jgi:hypothetical protein
LTPQQVAEIRASALSNRHFAIKFGVSYRAINKVRKGETYKHLLTIAPGLNKDKQ